jgi:cytoskeletal protein RodZ
VDDRAENGERLAAFGRWLARERELRGLARDEVGRVMKLAPGVVEALESGEEGRFPPRAYAVGWLRAYAAAVGLDADEVILRFEEASGPAPASGGSPPVDARGPARASGGNPPADARGRILVAILLAAAVVGAGAWALLR